MGRGIDNDIQRKVAEVRSDALVVIAELCLMCEVCNPHGGFGGRTSIAERGWLESHSGTGRQTCGISKFG